MTTRHLLFLPRLTIPTLLLLAALRLHGESNQYTGTNWTLINASNALAAAAEITLTKYPDCDAVNVEERNVQDYQKDGTGQNQDEAFIKVLTEKGKRNWRTLPVHYQLPYSTAAVSTLEVIKPSGTVKAIDVKANSKETIDNSQMAENIYDPNSKILEVNIPALEVGDVLHVVTQTTTERAVMPGEFDDENVLEGEDAIRHLVYEVHSPAGRPILHTVLRDEIAGTVKMTTQRDVDGTQLHRWEVSNVPRMFPEPAMPPFENVLQRVLVTTTPSWQDVSKWYWELSKPHLEALSPELKQKVTELTAGAPTDLDKVKALFYFVSQKIRYMGLTPEKDRPGFEPHDVCLTFAKKYGVCRDKAALLVAMLREAGFKAYPVLVSVGSKKDTEIPNPGFNHAIAAVELQAGEYTLMDPTDEHARDLLPWYDDDQSYLVARSEGETIRTSPVNPPDQNMLRINTTGTLSAAGDLLASSELSFSGANDDNYRGAFSQMKPDDLRRFFEGKLKDALPGAKLLSLKLTPSDMLDMSEQLKVDITYSVGGMIATGHGKALLTPPWIGKRLGLVNLVIRDAALEKRKYPLQTMVACGMKETMKLQLGAGFSGVESLPSSPSVENEGESYHESFHAEQGVLEGDREFKLKKIEFSPGQYLILKKALSTMQNDARKAPVMKLETPEVTEIPKQEEKSVLAAIPVASDALVLDVQKSLKVSDAHTAVYHVKYAKQILTYEGKIRESEIKVEYNPACEEVRLIKAVVISKSGERHEVSPGEINVMDADWSASAKRYTGGKILVASLPGVEIGSTLEEEYEITMKEKPFIAGTEVFQSPDALQKKSFQLTAPAGLSLSRMLADGGSVTTQSTTNTPGTNPVESQDFNWSVGAMTALPAEKGTPPAWLCIPSTTYFAGDFSAYLKELNTALLEHSHSGTKAAEAARQISSQIKNRADALRAIRDFVATSIRPAALSFTTLPLRELSDADTTLSEGYGHDADRAILLHAMLTAAGFQPEFVLASDLPAIEKIRKASAEVPLPEDFNYPLVKITLEGRVYYLNDTDQYAELGTTAHDNMLGILLSTQADETIQAGASDHNRTDTDYALTLSDNGQLQMKVTRRFYGEDYNEKNRFFQELRPEERKRYSQKLVSDVAQGARPLGDLSTQFDTYPGSEEFRIVLDNFAVVDGNYCYFALPFTPSLLELPGGEARLLPLEIPQSHQATLRTTITLPPRFPKIVISPASNTLEAPAESKKTGGGKVSIMATASARTFSLQEDLETSAGIVSPGDYPALLKLESQLQKKSSSQFLLKKKAP